MIKYYYNKKLTIRKLDWKQIIRRIKNMGKITKAVIPAAGLGTRFLPATKAQPKEMMPILDKPTLQYIIEEAAESGITDILIINGRGKESIVNHFDRSLELEQQLENAGKIEALEEVREITKLANIFYTRQNEPKGLGHAISLAEPFVQDEAFVVLLGDNVMVSEKPATKQLLDMYEKYQRSIIALMRVSDEDVEKYGIVSGQQEGNAFKIDGMVEKPSKEDAPSNLAIAGRYIIESDIFDILKDTKPGKNNEIQLTDALFTLCQKQDVYGYEYGGKIFDIGNKFGYLTANIEFGLMENGIRDQLENFFLDLVSGDEKLQKEMKDRIKKEILNNENARKELREVLDSYDD